MGGGGGVTEFAAEFKFAKIQNSHLCVWGGGGWGGSRNLMLSLNLLKSKFPFGCVGEGRGSRNLMLSSNLLKSKIPICGGGGGGFGGTNFQLLMLSPNLLKSKIPICVCVCVCGGGFKEFDAEFKFAKIQNSHLGVWGRGRGSRNLMLSSNLLKSKIPICGGGGVGGTNFGTFDAESKFAKIQNSHLCVCVGGGGS